MAITISTALRNHLLFTGSFKNAMDNSTLTIYSGGEPDVDSPATGNSLAVVGNSNLDFETVSTTDGVIKKNPTSQNWKTADNSTVAGQAGYYRLENGTKILQGNVKDDGTGDLNLATIDIPAEVTVTLDFYTVTLPGAEA